MDYGNFIHDVKNPLNVINGVAQLLPNANKKECAEYSKMLLNSVEYINSLCNDFNEYYNTGDAIITNTSIYIPDLLKNIAQEYKTYAASYNVYFVLDCNAASTKTDITKLKQIIVNLITNAIKYSNKTGRDETIRQPKKVILRCYTQKKKTLNATYIEVEDFGIGMSSSDIMKLNLPLFRGNKNDSPGTGLGMNIVDTLSKKLGCEYKIKSVLGKGTKIELVLP